MSGVLVFTCVGNGRRVSVRRDSDVPDDFWRKVRAEWGQSGSHPNVEIMVSVETFAARQLWLRPACRQFGVAVKLDAGTKSIVRRGRGDRERLREIRAGEDTLEYSEVQMLLAGTRFKRVLRPFQIRDLAKLLSLDHGANFSVPGAGKTTVELAVYEAERRRNRVDRALIVGPISSFDAWIQDSKDCLSPAPVIHRFRGNSVPFDTEILLVNYQRLASSYEMLTSWVQDRPTLVVLDEAHRMKRGRGGEWGNACLDLAFVAARRDLLTGTPAPQHPSDLSALMDYLWPGQASRILPSAALVPQPTPEAITQLSSAIKPLFVRTTKTELELPPTQKRVIKVPLRGLHREIYDSLRSRFSSLVKSQRERVQFAAWGEITMYLLEAATNPGLLPAGSSGDDPIEFKHPPLPVPHGSALHELISEYSAYETPEKFIQLAALVDALRSEGRKVLIWSNFIRNLQSLERLLSIHQPAIVHGGIPSEVSQPRAPRLREKEIARFREDPACGVLLANPAAMGEGVSLHQVCHEAIYLERTFNAGQYLQSVDRIHRLGLSPDQETRVTFLVSEDTIDEAVDARVRLKATNLGIMLDDPSVAAMSLPDEEDVGQPIDVGDDGDIAALFAHLRGESIGD